MNDTNEIETETDIATETETEIESDWYPRKLIERKEQDWPPVPTTESLSYWFAAASRSGEKYRDDAKYRRIIDTAAYCLEQVPADVAENVLYHIGAHHADPEKWAGTFNQLASRLWRPSVSAYEARIAMLNMMKAAA